AKSASKKKLAGNPSKRTRRKPAAAAAAVPPIAGGVDSPVWLSDSAKAEWTRTLPLLKEPLRPADVAAFSVYCQSVSDYSRAIATMEKEGHTYPHPNGTIVAHPAVKLA